MINVKLLSRNKSFFLNDFKKVENDLKNQIADSRILVVGGAGSIGFSTIKLLIKYNPSLLHVVDINENNLVELVRYVRSSIGYTKGIFETYPIDVASKEFENLVNKNNGYDVWMNFSALKHVRSERNEIILMRMWKSM